MFSVMGQSTQRARAARLVLKPKSKKLTVKSSSLQEKKALSKKMRMELSAIDVMEPKSTKEAFHAEDAMALA